MADFCRQCSLATFGKDYGDLANLLTEEQFTQDRLFSSVVICEGCGPIQVDHLGNCLCDDCSEQHGLPTRNQ
jgi:hypothetical protein